MWFLDASGVVYDPGDRLLTARNPWWHAPRRSALRALLFSALAVWGSAALVLPWMEHEETGTGGLVMTCHPPVAAQVACVALGVAGVIVVSRWLVTWARATARRVGAGLGTAGLWCVALLAWAPSLAQVCAS